MFPIEFDVSNRQCFQSMFPIYILPYLEFEPSMREVLIEKLNGLIPKQILQQMALPGREIGPVHHYMIRSFH